MPFTWFVNNRNNIDTAPKGRNNNSANTNKINSSLIDNIMKNDSDLYQDSYLSNILNGSKQCVNEKGQWILHSEKRRLEKLGEFSFSNQDGFSNYNKQKKTLGMAYISVFSLLILFMAFRLK